MVSSIQIMTSNVGNFPSNISSVSIVSLSHPQMLFIIPSSTSAALAVDDKPMASSSSLQELLYLSPPSLHLHPSLIEWIHIRMSSMYLAPSISLMLDLAITSSSLSSHQSITILAMAQVDLRPIGPPTLCRKKRFAKL